MPELTQQEKLERRRQKRQQRILQAGESRLSKITGTAYPDRASPSPSTSSSSIKQTTPTESADIRAQRRNSDDPSEELGAPPPMDASAMMNQSFASMFGGVAGVPGTGNDMNQQQELLQQVLGSSGFPAGMFGNMAGMAGMAGDQQQQQQQQQQENDKSLRYWNLLHFIIMCLLGFYAVYFEWMHAGPQRFAALTFGLPVGYPSIHVPLFWYFVTVELGLQSARMFYHKGGAPPSTLATFAAQLPNPFGNIITIFLRYRLIWTCLVQDCSILIFIIGLSQVVSTFLV